MQQRVRGGHGVIDFVRHDTDQLFVRRPLELPQLLGQLFDQHESCAGIRDRRTCHGDTSRAAHRSGQHRASPGASDASAVGERRTQLLRGPPDNVGGGRVQQAFGRRIDVADALIEIEDHDARRRDLQHLTEEMMLLREPHPLLAQVIDHPVVDADQVVDLRLADSRNRDVNSSSRISRKPSAAKPRWPYMSRRASMPTASETAKTASTASSQNGFWRKRETRERREHQRGDDEVGDGTGRGGSHR